MIFELSEIPKKKYKYMHGKMVTHGHMFLHRIVKNDVMEIHFNIIQHPIIYLYGNGFYLLTAMNGKYDFSMIDFIRYTNDNERDVVVSNILMSMI